eukprot:g3483.t1
MSIEASDCVVFVCDIQRGKLLTLIQNEETVRKSARMVVEVAGILGNVPVVVTEQVPEKLGNTHEDIKSVLPKSAEIFPKTQFSMITSTVKPMLQKMQRKTAILVGVEAHVCVLQTCEDLLREGWGVHVVVDAVSSQRDLDRDVAFRRMERCGAFLTTSESLVFHWLKDSKSPHFRTCSKKCVAKAKDTGRTKCVAGKEKTPGRATVGKNARLRLNTSNTFKFQEFKRMFALISHGKVTLDRTKIDLEEIDAPPAMVIAQKATSAGENVIVEDTSLDVAGADVGVNVRWIMDNLSNFVGRHATWRVMLGVLRGRQVFVYEGIVEGTIVPKRGKSAFGFDPVFQPRGSARTLAEEKPDRVSARFKAIEALLNEKPSLIHVPIFASEWKGKWQSH